MTAHTVANIILHVVLISCFIAFFFFIYAARSIEPEVITIQVDRTINDMTSDLKAFLTDSQKSAIKSVFATAQPPNLSQQDAQVAQNNAILLKKAATYLGLFFVIGITVVIILSFIYKFSFLELLKENILSLVVVAAVEFFFLSFFAKNYRTLDQNMVKLGIVNGIQLYIQGTS
jgi:hypothetical protein